jgi:hypothetical protein
MRKVRGDGVFFYWREDLKFALGLLVAIAVVVAFSWLLQHAQRNRDRVIRECGEKQAIAVVIEDEWRCVRLVD